MIKNWRAERFGAPLLALTLLSLYNTGYTAHFDRPNRITPTSYSPKMLGDILLGGYQKIEKQQSRYANITLSNIGIRENFVRKI